MFRRKRFRPKMFQRKFVAETLSAEKAFRRNIFRLEHFSAFFSAKKTSVESFSADDERPTRRRGVSGVVEPPSVKFTFLAVL